MSIASSTYTTELVNVFCMNVTVEGNSITLKNNAVVQHWLDNTKTTNLNYDGNPIYKIYGIRR